MAVKKSAPIKPPTHRASFQSPPPPSPLDLLKIAHIFQIITPEMFEPIQNLDADEMIGWKPLVGSDDQFQSALETAAHLYHIAGDVAREFAGVDPWEARANVTAATNDLRAVYKLWSSLRKEGKLIPETEAQSRLNYKTLASLRALFQKFGYKHASGQPVTTAVIDAILLLKERWDTTKGSATRDLRRKILKGIEESLENLPEKVTTPRRQRTLLVTERWLLKELPAIVEAISPKKAIL